jgi:short-subunit dehydrogenase
MISLKQKYGQLALVAGASEGIGAAFSHYLASKGMDLVIVARRKEPLEQLANLLMDKYQIKVDCICCDLSDTNAALYVEEALNGKEINLLVYNAAMSYIGAFELNNIEHHNKIATTNMITPMNMMHTFGEPMLKMEEEQLLFWHH